MPQDISKPNVNINNSQKISWTAPEFAYYEKSKKWFVWVGILALIFVVIFIFSKLYAGAAVVIAFALVLYTQSNLKPKQIVYLLDNQGLHFKEKTLEFKQIKSFWITATDFYPQLHLQKLGKLTMPVMIYLKGIRPEIVQFFLQQYLPEDKENKGSLHENISRIIKF